MIGDPQIETGPESLQDCHIWWVGIPILLEYHVDIETQAGSQAHQGPVITDLEESFIRSQNN